MNAPPGASKLMPRRADQIAAGDAIVIRGVGMMPVREVAPLPSGELLIVLGWDRLAVISSPESEWVVLPSPMPGTVLERRDRQCQRCGGRGYL